MKNKFLLIVITIMLSMPAISLRAEDSVQIPENEPAAVEQINEEVQNIMPQEDVINPEIQAVEAEKTNLPYKQPISKRKLVKKFLLAMFAVGVSSLLLYFGLTVYNRIRDGLPVQVKTPEGETPLSSPTDLESATQTFLDKTKWN